MLHVILLILKIIGITLLIIIGLLLLILLTVLLVPIRYQISVTHGEEFYLESKASWLLHLIKARVSHINGILHIRIRILWMVLYDNQKPKQPKVKKKVKKKVKTVTKKKRIKVQTKVIKKNTEIIINKDGKSKVEENNKKITEVSSELTHQNVVLKESIRESKVIQQRADSDKIEVGKATNQQVGSDNIKEIDQKSIYMEEKLILKDFEEKESIFRKIFNKIKNIKIKIVAFFSGIKRKIITGLETIANLKYKANLILEFIKDEMNKEGFRVTYSSLKKLLKHILPTKLESKIIFGTGDPCSTGQALGFMGILYSLYGDKVVIIPDFENARFEGEHFARGRIRLITLLIIVIKLILDKRFKQLKNNFQILKEAL